MQRRLLVLLLLFGSFSLVYSSIAYYSFSEPPAQRFMSFGVFSSSGTLSNYFSGTGMNVTVHEGLNWHFEIANQMGSVQYVQIVYRLGNASSMSPDATASATTVQQVGNSSIFVANGHTETLNFAWNVTSRNVRAGTVYVNMGINGQQVSPSTGAVDGLKFRFFFELWTYDTGSNSFQYGYKSQNSRIGAPLQVWFNSV